MKRYEKNEVDCVRTMTDLTRAIALCGGHAHQRRRLHFIFFFAF